MWILILIITGSGFSGASVTMTTTAVEFSSEATCKAGLMALMTKGHSQRVDIIDGSCVKK
jgi:hypothetical protein